MRVIHVLFGCIVSIPRILCQEENLVFPDSFMFGASVSAIQTEGAWNVSDKTESVWDRWVHDHPWEIADGSNADVACNSYYKYKEDVQMVKQTGFDFYRFSISWPRLIPKGFGKAVSQDGLEYYKNLTQELLDNGIEPVVTMFHHDMPQVVSDLGGWTNEQMIEWFADLADVIFKELGPMVKIFVTINEPQLYCSGAYGKFHPVPFPPVAKIGPYGEYLCIHNMLKAHARVWHLYNDKYRSDQGGRVGPNVLCGGHEPLNASNPEDISAANVGIHFDCDWFIHPLYFGDYSELVKHRMAAINQLDASEGYEALSFSRDWMESIKGAMDFVSINYYFDYEDRFQTADEFAKAPSASGILSQPSRNTNVTEFMFGSILRGFRDAYGNPDILVTEIGFNDSGAIEDYERIKFYNEYLKVVHQAVTVDNCNVFGFTVWSFMDNFEFMEGYTRKYGIYSVDFTSDDRPRTPKLSAAWWNTVLKTRQIQPIWTNTSQHY